MKKIARILAVLAAAVALGTVVVSCDYWKEDWYDGEKSENAPLTGSTSSGSVTYAGSLSVNGTSYTSLSMTGSSSSGNALLSGSAGSVSGSYAASGTSRAASTLNLSGTYTLTFSFGIITVVISSNTASLSAGTVAASGTASVSTESSTTTGSSAGGTASGAAATGTGTTTTPASTEPAISTLNGKTFVNSSNSSNYIVGTSDSTCDWHNPPTYAVNLWTSALSTGMPSVNGATYDPSTGVITGCTYTICRGGEGNYSTFSEPYIEINYGTGSSPETIASATQFGSYVQQ